MLARLQATPQRTYTMAMLRLRITGTEDDARAISDLLLGRMASSMSRKPTT